jgi:hypothetical protein
MDTYALERLTGWTPELSPPPDTPLFRWRVLAGDVEPTPRLVASKGVIPGRAWRGSVERDRALFAAWRRHGDRVRGADVAALTDRCAGKRCEAILI